MNVTTQHNTRIFFHNRRTLMGAHLVAEAIGPFVDTYSTAPVEITVHSLSQRS